MKTVEEIHIGSRVNVPAHEILLLKADNNYTEIFLINGRKILSSTTMGTIEKRLNDFDFFRPNRSTVINLQYLEKVEMKRISNSNLSIRSNKKQKALNIKISRRRRASLFALINA